MLISFFHNMTLMVFLVLITVRIKSTLIKKRKYKLVLNLILTLTNGLMAVLVMLDPIKEGDTLYYLSSVPIYLSAYLGGWVPGILTGLFPTIFRLYLNGGVIGFCLLTNILLPIVFAASLREKLIFYQDLVNIKKALKVFSIYFLTKTIISLIFLSFPLQKYLTISVSMYLFSMVSLIAILMIVYESTQGHIMHNNLQKRNEELQKEKEKLQRYLGVAEVIVLILDKNHRIKMINKKGTEIFGHSISEIEGKNFFNYVKQEDLYKVEQKFSTMLNKTTQNVGHCECSIINNKLEEREILWTCTSLKDEQDRFEGILCSGIDITRRKILQHQLEYNKLITQFFANLSHEMRTPLNLMFSAIQMLTFYSPEASSGHSKKYLHVIKQNIFRMLKLVDNIIDVTKINSNQFKIKKQPCDIVQLIQKIVDSVADYTAEKERILHFNSEKQQKIIVCDPFLVERIVLNLISNALKFTEHNDEIWVNLSLKNDGVIVSVKDTGIGIPVDKQKIIFERFHQVDKSFRRIHEGSGLGLYIVKLLTELHNGSVGLISEYGEGSEFTIYLPTGKLPENMVDITNFINEDTIDRVDIELSDIYA